MAELGAFDAVHIKGLSYWYPDEEKPVLEEINLDIQQGEFVVIVGPSGCGKSTLALCLNGIIPQVMGGKFKGSIKVSGKDTLEYGIHEMATEVGMIFQDPDSQLCNIYVRDEVAFGAQNLLVPKDEILRRLQRALEFVGMSDHAYKVVFSLSGGQKQRVSIASVLVMEPKVIVLDEPTANLDPAGCMEVAQLIRDINRTHQVTTIVIEHDISNIIDLADRLVVMDNGHIIFNGTPREILADKGVFIRDQLGLWLPEVCEFALAARKRGYVFSPFPLKGSEIPIYNLEFQAALSPNSEPSVRERYKGDSARKSEVVASLQDVTLRYPDGTLALQGINCQIYRQQIVALVGQNGSGKSTFASLLIGLHRPTAGRVEVCGLDTTRTSIRDLARKVGYVFQYPEHQFVTDNVFDEVAVGLRNQGLSEEQVRVRVMSILAMFRLDHLVGKHPFNLSLGQKRRLSIASMLAYHPEILILDEPTSGQDFRNAKMLMDILVDLKNTEGLTVILITHNMRLVAEYADTVIVLNNGRLVYQGVPEALFESGHVAERYQLAVPETLRLLKQIHNVFPHLPFEPNPVYLANMLVERSIG
ncbi:energy-coupling factor transporter ATPase [Moorellaceae bacterium AZ2]